MLEASDREIYPIDIVPTPSSRRPFGEYTSTLAMHWDGTYRDRLAGSDPGEFWSDFQYKHFEGPASPSVINAKHLA